ncbi:MAG TPA: SDR family oxidoreductase [Bdellovibrionota bacterium]|jgi:NAD(P)-dependent dehydrogenase (short-subunit alcohol dehydrogenase family)|nr:SDR family oxidoreductase [Bdellovibrionota bacterium]
MVKSFGDEPPLCMVSGGSGLIGIAVCKLFLKEGYRVVCVDRAGPAKGSFSPGDPFDFVKCDVRKPPQIAAAVKRCARLDVLINLVGISDPNAGPLERLSLETWNEYLQTNLTSYFLFMKHASPKLKAARGSIVNVSSTRAIMSEPDCEAYAATKGGIVGLSHAAAISLGPEVKVNCISPGWIGDPQKKYKAAESAQHPAGRVGRPEDIAELCIFLASATKSGFIRGQNIVCDGGMIRKMIYI